MRIRNFSGLALILGGVTACAPLTRSPLQTGGNINTKAPAKFSSTDTERDVKEVTLSASSFSERNALEGYLLYRAAVLTKENGFEWFTLRHLPGEGGPDSHPTRTAPHLGAAYAHWQPHWSYYVKGAGWQPWHPEWGVRFWADEIDLRSVERFELHAMVKMAHERTLAEPDMNFDAYRVIRDFGPAFSGASF